MASVYFIGQCGSRGACQVALVVKNPPANAGDIRDGGSIPGLGRSPGGGMATHSSILAQRTAMDRGACDLAAAAAVRLRKKEDTNY